MWVDLVISISGLKDPHILMEIAKGNRKDDCVTSLLVLELKHQSKIYILSKRTTKLSTLNKSVIETQTILHERVMW